MIHIQKDIPLAPFSTFHIGGRARYFVEAATPAEIIEAIEYAEKERVPHLILGGGSNVLFSDRGYPGLIIHIQNREIVVETDRVSAGAGAVLLAVIHKAVAAELAGLERLAGIPGSFGGAVRGNAGAFGAEIGDLITRVKCFDAQTGLVREFQQKECHFSYRSSIFKRTPELIIVSADLRLEKGDEKTMHRIMEETIAKRQKKHPQDALCAGSFFMNPVVHNEKLKLEFEKDTGEAPRGGKLPAGWLIDHVGLRGKQIGGATVSLLHPNYLLNTGTATAEDVIILASLVKMRVRDELGIQLKEEVQYVGF